MSWFKNKKVKRVKRRELDIFLLQSIINPNNETKLDMIETEDGNLNFKLEIYMKNPRVLLDRLIVPI